MLDIKKNYVGVFPEFRETIPQLQKKDKIYHNIRQRVTVLESNEVKNRHAEVRAELNLDVDLKPIYKVEKSKEVDGAAGDPAYYKEFLGTSLDWDNYSI